MTILSQISPTGRAMQLLADAHGSTRNVVNIAVGLALLERYVYSPYGVDLGIPTSPLTAVRYAGQMIDALTGLSFNRARWYDPSAGTFTTLDPEEGNASTPLSFNHYLYGDGNPVTNSDPTGRDSLAELVFTVGEDEGIDTYQNAAKASKAAIQSVKLLIGICLVTMETEVFRLSLSNEIPGGVAAGTIATAYYVYESKSFVDRLASPTTDVKIVRFEANIAGYLASLPNGIALLDSVATTVSAKAVNLLPSGVKGNADTLLFMPLTGRRYIDDKLAYGIRGGLTVTSLVAALTTGNPADVGTTITGIVKSLAASKAAGYTWHHNEVMGIMELIQTGSYDVVGNKAEGHTGGAAFWGWIRGISPYPS